MSVTQLTTVSGCGF